MNRRSFFKFLGIGAATAVVAPKMLAERKLDKVVSATINPVSWRGSITYPVGDYHVYEEPISGYDYSIGVETGHGLGGDPSVVSVMRVGKEKEPDVQVAEFVSHEHNPAQLTSIVALRKPIRRVKING